MNEMNPNLPPTLDTALIEFYQGPQPDSAFAKGLETLLRQRQIELMATVSSPPSSRQKPGSLLSANRSSFMRMLRTRPILVVIAVILGLLLLTGVAYAVGRLTGFIPGIGFVQDVHLVLETPVVVQREMVVTPLPETTGLANTKPVIQDPTPAATNEARPDASPTALFIEEKKGITITVEQVVAEADRLVIAYKISGMPPNIFGPERAEKLSAEQNTEDPFMVDVRIPDGTLLKLAKGGTCQGSSDLVTSWLSCRLVRSPLPDGVNRFTLEIHRLPNALPGELPEDWLIPINLTPVTSSQSASSLQKPNLSSQSVNGITLRLIKVDQSLGQTAFQLGVDWQGANRMVGHTAPVTLQDAQSRYYILTGGPDGGSYSMDKTNFATLPSLVTTPVDGSSPLTFRVDWISMSVSPRSADNSAAILKFDPGKTARVGQEWSLDQNFQAGEFNLHFTKARLKAAQEGGFTLEFDIQTPLAITRVNLFPKEATSSSNEGGYDKSRGVMVSRVTLPTLPTQPVELYVSEIIYKVNGPWEITWQPQRVNIPFTTPTPAPTRMAPPGPTLIPNEPLLSEMERLLSKAASPIAPGWVHQVMQLDQAAPIGTLNTSDQPEQPLQMHIDAWFLLDEQGYIRTTVTIRKTMDGKLISADVDNGIYHFSLPEGRGGIGQDIYLAKPSYNYDLLSIMNSYVAEGGKVSQENSKVDGKSCRLFAGMRTYDPPQIFSNEPAPVNTMVHSACIDPTTGAVLQIQNKMIYSDGTTRVKDTTDFISLEKVETLPDEVRQLMEKVVMP